MNRSELLPLLNMSTLLLVLAFIVIGGLLYWRKRSNRPPRDGGPPTADGSR